MKGQGGSHTALTETFSTTCPDGSPLGLRLAASPVSRGEGTYLERLAGATDPCLCSEPSSGDPTHSFTVLATDRTCPLTGELVSVVPYGRSQRLGCVWP
jgi:hypothetical protein